MHRSLLLPLVLSAACSDGDSPTSRARGNAKVFIVAEESIAGGVQAGSGPENIQDGWTVTYSKFLVSLGGFHAKSNADGEQLLDPTTFVLDLKNAPTAGYVTSSFQDVPAVQYDVVGQDMPIATASSKVVPPTTEADKKQMVDGGFSLFVAGKLTKPDGKSCTPGKPTECVDAKEIRFSWGFAMATAFDDCAPAAGNTGFAVSTGGTVNVQPTIHGDHWFFAETTQGAEVTKRYAQYIADGDLNHDGETTVDELKLVKSSDVFPADKYKLSGGVDGPINTAWDYVRSQARTLHDFQGDGECPTRRVIK
jgi:hypothetical protein